jgi:hypothetical protein
VTELINTQPLRTVIEEGSDADPLRPVDRSARPDHVKLDGIDGLEGLDAGASRAEVLTSSPGDLKAALPDGVALLCVSPSSGGERGRRLTMSWHHNGSRILEAHDRGLEQESDEGGNQSIAQIMQAAQDPGSEPLPPGVYGGPWHAAYMRTTDCWAGFDDLGDWVADLRKTAPDRAHLVIWDTSGEDIPWELYHGKIGVDRNGLAKEGWLGVTVPISRWVGGHPQPENYGATEIQAAGGVLLFDDGKTHPGAGYKNVYAGLEHLRVGELEDCMDDLLERLEGDEKFGLLMIRGHGVYGETTETFQLAGVPLILLNNLEMEALGNNRPAVLLGLCSSGRTFVQKGALNRPVRSFVDRFINRGASAVIAILAEVDITHLSGLTNGLIRDAQAQPVVIAEWLQRHHAKYFKKLQAKHGISAKQKEEWYRMFLTSSLFVCYCHPRTTLHVQAVEPVQAAERGAAPLACDGEGDDDR